MKYLLFVLLISLAGCATMEDNMESWIGQSVDNAISEFGPPDKESSLANGGKVYQWTRTAGTSGQATQFYGTVYANAATNACTLRFTTDSLGTIKYASWNGNACN